jgi:site-specific recombinase
MANKSLYPVSLAPLLDALDPDADLVHRHLWLIALMQWIRGNERDAETAASRVDILLDVLDARPATRLRLQLWWRQLIGALDGSTLLADFGFASQNAFVGELVQRIHYKLLPASPETVDAAELFALVMPSAQDAQWIGSLPPATLERLGLLLSTPALGHHGQSYPQLTYWQSTLLDALTYCVSQVRAAGFSPEMRLRMSNSAYETSPFHTLANTLDTVRAAWLANHGVEDAAQALKLQLEACRQAAATVYTHLDAHGISVDLVFRLRQLRERVLRIRILLDCLLQDPHHSYSAKLFTHLATIVQERRSVGALVSASSSLLAAKVAERSSETGEHYITRNRAEYRSMLRNAAGGGALTALTTAGKFAIVALGFSAFWTGAWSGLLYAVSFVVIQLLHFTLATKQPAMTAPAMAAKLKDITDPAALESFVDEVTHLVRSQVAAVLGNVVVVFPAVLLLSGASLLLTQSPMIDATKALHVLDSLTLAGPSVLFAAFTGVLLFASSIIAGWVENWFVLHRLDSAVRYNPRITRWLGVQRADRWAHFMRHHISGFASNISLGFMLGLVPAVLTFVGVGLDVRHVTLSTGQLAAACAALGWDVVRQPALWWAVASIPLIGALNLGVSFYLAFRVALQAHNVSDGGRSRIRRAIWQRLRHAPLRFIWPAADEPPHHHGRV